jgi:hypothetical protein
MIFSSALKSLSFLLSILSLTKADFLIDQRLKEQNRLHPPADPFFNTFYDKSYYLHGALRPVYHVSTSQHVELFLTIIFKN